MNLRDLMTKLDTIAEADDARAQYDKFKADDARAGAITQVKTMLKPNGGGNFIDPKDGIVKWQEQMQGDSGGPGSVREFPFDWYKKGQESKFFDILKTAGLELVPVDRKNLFGTSQVVGIKGGPQALADIDKPKPPTPTPGPTLTPGPKGNDDAAKLEALVAQLEATLKGEGPMPTPDVVKPDVVVPPVKEKEKTLGQKAGIGAGIGAGALAGGALGKKYGGAKGAALGALTGGALGGLGVNAFQKEGIEFNSSMAQSLTESFGYEFENEQLDEYSMQQFGQDAGDFGRGAWNGATLGTGDNIVAGVKSAFGPDTYKDELKKQTAASQEAEKRSPWLYGAGNVAGSIAAPVPGGAIAGGLIKGASTAAKLARGATALGTNLAAQAGVDKLKQASDIKTLAQGGDQKLAQLQTVIKTIPDGKMGPNTQKALAAWQAEQGLPATGKPDPATYAKAGIAESKVTTVAEDIKSLQDKLAMIESGQWRLEEDADYRVWLTEDNTVIDDYGNQIVDKNVLDAIEWDQQRLDELNLGGIGKALGRGWDKVANVGRNFAGGLAGKDATGNLIKDTEKTFASRMASPKANGKIRSAAEIARDSTNARGTANMANKAANWVGQNPGKTALGAAALGAGGIAAANALGGGSASETGTTTGGGGGGGGGGADSDPNMPQAPAGTTPGTTPAAGALTPEQQALIKQIKDLALKHGEDESPEWLKATGHMQVVLDKAEKASPAQQAADAKNDVPAATNATADTTKGPNMGQVNKPDASGQAAAPTGTTGLPKVPAGTTVDSKGVTTPDPTLKVYKDGGGAGSASNPANVKESEDELARWLRIARG